MRIIVAMMEEKTKGRKRHIVTDIMGNILAVHIHAANVHDTKGGCYIFANALQKYPSIKAGCADGGYRGTFKRVIEALLASELTFRSKSSPNLKCCQNDGV